MLSSNEPRGTQGDLGGPKHDICIQIQCAASVLFASFKPIFCTVFLRGQKNHPGENDFRQLHRPSWPPLLALLEWPPIRDQD